MVPGQTIVTGWLYDLQKSYDLKDNKWHTILSLDPQHPNIIIPPDQKSKYRVDTSLQQGRIALNIVDKKTNQTLFTYYPVSQQASPYQSLQINNAQYKSIALNNTSNPDLNGGTCIAKIWWECEILIDKQGNPLIPSPYSQTLSTSYTPKNAGTATYQFQDSNANPIASVSVVLKPLN